jgi:hypothetical protein
MYLQHNPNPRNNDFDYIMNDFTGLISDSSDIDKLATPYYGHIIILCIKLLSFYYASLSTPIIVVCMPHANQENYLTNYRCYLGM